MAGRVRIGSVTNKAGRDVLAERERQIKELQYTPKHDAFYEPGSLARAAGVYALRAFSDNAEAWDGGSVAFENFWPWREESYNPKSPRENLVRAAALLLAEIDKYDAAKRKANRK